MNKFTRYDDKVFIDFDCEICDRKCDFCDVEDCLEAAKQRLYDLENNLNENIQILPCKIGDILWTNFSMSGWYLRDKDKPYQVRVVFIGLNDSDEMGGGFVNVLYEKNGNMMQFNFSDIGKNIFYTKEEALMTKE